MIKGCDISVWQNTVNFDQLKGQVDFVVIRSSYGNGYTDKQFQRNRDEIRRVGITLGYYHYAYPQYNTPEAEADWFLQVIGTPNEGEFLCLDFEESFGDPVGWSKKFLDRVASKLNGYKPLVYLNLSLVQNHDWTPIVKGDYGLWLAHWDYNFEANPVTTPWPLVAMRQYSNNETFQGITGRVDANVFYGDASTLKAYGYHPKPTNQPPADQDSYRTKGIQMLDNYRNDPNDNKQGPEGNYEGYVARLLNNDRRFPSLIIDLENSNKEVEAEGAEITQLIAQQEQTEKDRDSYKESLAQESIRVGNLEAELKQCQENKPEEVPTPNPQPESPQPNTSDYSEEEKQIGSWLSKIANFFSKLLSQFKQRK